MQITRLRAVNFRRFDDVDLDFAGGINLVRGPNESGKSTLVMAVMAGLFARPHANTALGRSYLRWGTGQAPLLELEFIHDGVSYRLVKDFVERSASLEEGGGAPLRSIKAVNARVFELIGFSDPARYLRTACVTHDQMVSLAEDATGARKLAGMLREIVVGGRESSTMESAARKLASEVEDLKRGLERPTGNPGVIRRLVDEREALTERQRELTRDAEDLRGHRRRLQELENLLGEKEPGLAELEEAIAGNRRCEELERRAAAARQRFDAADRVIEAARELERRDKKIKAGFAGFLDLDPGVENELKKAEEVRRSLSELRRELASAPAEDGVEAPETGPPPRPLAWWVAMGAGALIMLAGVILGALQPVLFAVAAVGLAVIAAAAYSLRAVPPPAQAVMDLPRLLDDRLRRADREIARLEAREREFLKSVGCDDPEEFFAAFRTYREQLAERDREAAGLDALLGGRKLAQVEEERRGASLEAAGLAGQLEELASFRVEPGKAGNRTHVRDGLAETVAELRKERDGLAFHVMRAGKDPEDAARIEEEVAWLWEAEQVARRRLRVYTMARDAMRQTAESLLSGAVPVLSESVGRMFSRLTGGRYDTVDVSESDLALSVYSKEKGGFIPADELLGSLSKGTASQLYLAARLELVDLLSGGRRPPLIFDDSFSYFDDRRLEFLWNVLLEVSRDQQVIVLTCTNRYDGLVGPGVRLVELQGG